MIHPRKVLSSVLLGSVLALGLSACSQPTELTLSDGDTLVWENLRGEWVFVNYWAEWCKPCYEEIPELNALDQEDAMTVLGVNFDGEQGASLQRVMQDMGIDFTVLQQDPGPQFDWEKPLALPATLIINPQGELVEARFGEQTKAQLLEATE